MKKVTGLFLPLLLIVFSFSLHSCSEKKVETFEVGEGTFLLNGEPFVVKAAEMHYPRIPREYWEHRILLSKALGMNTICLYVFWNTHEPVEGKFDFSGNKDVAAFVKLAQKHGMYIIVRPGPYVCAEWEMGGLPWWLLKKEDIKLRDLDPYYMERVEVFMNEVGKQLSPYSLANGGNILMVQVENEMGAYEANKPYVAAVRDIVRNSGFDDVTLFQCDWNSNFEDNALDDLLWTINFGTGANIDDQFERLLELRPNTPLMCSEFWSGWFDHWGAKHETRSAHALVEGMKEMMERNISFSLYMTHGGTSFGHWGGANFPNFSPTATSYDYDAPIGEHGNVTEKYHEVRNLLKNYLPEGETLIDIPDSIPTISIPEIEFEEVAYLFDNLPASKKSEKIRSMEFFDQGWGTIIYRTQLPETNTPQTLKITEAHDWAQVFIDGEWVGVLNRLRGDGSVTIPAVKQGAQLDIVVEAMGRMNFGKGIYDWKGITEKVELISEAETIELTGWEVFSIPVDYSFAKKQAFKKQDLRSNQPGYYRASFILDKVGDTFIDMMNWKKGMVYINGHNIGRFWEIGPQQTLYMPGCWLKKGRNEIIILDMSGPEVAVTQGVRKPVLDVLRGSGAYKHRKASENLDLSGEKAVYSGSFSAGHGWKTVKFDRAYDTRYFCLEALSSQNGDPYASMAELELLDENGEKLSRQHWKVIYADSEEVDDANNVATNVFDLQESTIWHTSYSITQDPYPHHLVIDLGENKLVSGFQYLPRMEANKPGMIKDFKAYIKMNPFKL